MIIIIELLFCLMLVIYWFYFNFVVFKIVDYIVYLYCGLYSKLLRGAFGWMGSIQLTKKQCAIKILALKKYISYQSARINIVS